MKVVHLSSAHPAHDVRILHKECRTLSKAGYDVSLVALNDGDEAANAVRIVGLPEPKNRVDRLTRSVWRAFRAALREKAELCHFHDPGLIPMGLLLRLGGKRVVYDVHENIPHSVLTKDYLPPFAQRVVGTFAGWMERAAATFFQGVVAATPTIAARFPARKTVTVQNFPVLRKFRTADRTPYAEREPIVVYLGTMTHHRGTREIVEAINLVPPASGARLALVGFFEPPEFRTELEHLPGWGRVNFLGWQSRKEVAGTVSQARAGLAVLHPRPSYLDSYPVKLFEYMAAGIPVIASDFPLWRRIVEEAGCGLLVDPLAPESIAKAIQDILADPKEAEAMGARGRQAAEDRFNWEHEGRKLIRFYRQLADEDPENGEERSPCAR